MQWLDARLRELGISRRELARRSGLRAQTINQIANGGGCLLDTFLQLGAALPELVGDMKAADFASLAYQKGETDPQKRLRAMRTVPNQPEQVPKGATP